MYDDLKKTDLDLTELLRAMPVGICVGSPIFWIPAYTGISKKLEIENDRNVRSLKSSSETAVLLASDFEATKFKLPCNERDKVIRLRSLALVMDFLEELTRSFQPIDDDIEMIDNVDDQKKEQPKRARMR